MFQSDIVAFSYPSIFNLAPCSPFRPSCVDISSGSSIQESPHPPSHFSSLFQNRLSNATAIYTDGSKAVQGDYFGFAIVCPSRSLSLKYRVPHFVSIFSAEALAILLTLEIIISKDISNAIIFSDSLSSLQAIRTSSLLSSTSPFIIAAREYLSSTAAAELNIHLAWIPAHLGISGNESADLLTEEAIKNGSDFRIKFSPSEFYPIFRKMYSKNTDASLTRDSDLEGSIYFQLFYRPAVKPRFNDFKRLLNKLIVLFNRMRSKHYNLSASLHRKNMAPSPVCQCRFEAESHFLGLPSLWPTTHQSHPRSNQIQNPPSIQHWILLGDSVIQNYLSSFLEECKLSF